jgi:VCBS repeat-containing protein
VRDSRDGASVYDIQIDAAKMLEGDADFDAIAFPDKDLLFAADFKRLGSDLLLAAQGGKTAIVYGYFDQDRPASLATLDGATLTGNTVEALAGPDRPGEYAQTTAANLNLKPIGRVEKVSGSATVLRNGVPVTLHLGDIVAKGDVVQTGSDSSLTIKFNDGTVFGLSSSARIVLNDMVYVPNGHDNSAFLTLVQGVIGFVAGRIAKTGDLKIDTPVATMAIRGTAVQTEISAVSGTTKFSLLTEPDGRVGSFVLLSKRNPSHVLTSISDPGTATIVAAAGLSDVSITRFSKTPTDLRIENDLVRELFQTFSPEPRQRRGGSDFDGPSIIPANTDLPSDRSDSPNFALTPFIPRLPDPPAAIQIPPLPTVAVNGDALEDGPFAPLGAVSGVTGLAKGIPPPAVIVPASLPPGVVYQEATRTFTLDPSHPAYQSLAEGQTATVTLDYSLLYAGVQTPASVTWTVTGENDAPVARNDRIVNVDESGRSELALRSNDSDIDGDSLRVVQWTQPIEGSVQLSSSGSLMFIPGSDFLALSAGETATVTFTYTISDRHGGTDTATATVQVQGKGVFSSRHIQAQDSDILAFNDQPVSLTIDAPSRTTTATADLTLKVGLDPVPQPQTNILYVVDISGSTTDPFAGTPVGDLNQDGTPNTILDAEIASLTRLTERVRSLGFASDDVTVTIIPFNGSANPADDAGAGQNGSNTASVTFNLGASGDETIANFLRGLNAGGDTNFEDALRAAIEKLQALDQGGEENLVYFLSDGNGTGSFEDELATLESDHQATISAVGIGQNADLPLLDLIDNTNGAERVTSTDQLDDSLLGSPVPGADIIDVDVFVNGREVPGVGREDLVSTTGGFALDLTLTGLDRQVGDTNTVSASILFASGEILTAELQIAGARPQSADLIL